MVLETFTFTRDRFENLELEQKIALDLLSKEFVSLIQTIVCKLIRPIIRPTAS